MPGRGKTVLVSYFLGRAGSIRAGLTTSVILVLTHVGSAVVIVRPRARVYRLHAEINVTLPSQITISAAHAIAEEVRYQLLHRLKYLSIVVIHVDPEEKSGERYHRIEQHSHDGLVHTHMRRSF